MFPRAASFGERVLVAGITGLGSVPLFCVVGLGALLLVAGPLELWSRANIDAESITGTEWSPADGKLGIVALTLATIVSGALAIVPAALVGLPAASYLTVFASRRLRAFAEAAIQMLAGLPAVVVGLFVYFHVVVSTGHSLLATVVALALMITPTFTALATAALAPRVERYLRAARSVGLSDSYAILRILLPAAAHELTAALLLAFARAAGEAVAVTIVAGNVVRMPALAEPTATLASILCEQVHAATGEHEHALYMLGFVLFFLLTVVSLLARRLQSARGGAQ